MVIISNWIKYKECQYFFVKFAKKWQKIIKLFVVIYLRFGYILNVINAATYMLQNDETKWFCIECSNVSVLPKQSWIFLLNSTNQLNDAMNSSDLSNLITYYTIDKFNKNFMSNSFSGTDLLHLNISSLPYNYEQLHALLADIDIIYITETILGTGQKAMNNINQGLN